MYARVLRYAARDDSRDFIPSSVTLSAIVYASFNHSILSLIRKLTQQHFTISTFYWILPIYPRYRISFCLNLNLNGSKSLWNRIPEARINYYINLSALFRNFLATKEPSSNNSFFQRLLTAENHTDRSTANGIVFHRSEISFPPDVRTLNEHFSMVTNR